MITGSSNALAQVDTAGSGLSNVIDTIADNSASPAQNAFTILATTATAIITALITFLVVVKVRCMRERVMGTGDTGDTEDDRSSVVSLDSYQYGVENVASETGDEERVTED